MPVLHANIDAAAKPIPDASSDCARYGMTPEVELALGVPLSGSGPGALFRRACWGLCGAASENSP